MDVLQPIVVECASIRWELCAEDDVELPLIPTKQMQVQEESCIVNAEAVEQDFQREFVALVLFNGFVVTPIGASVEFGPVREVLRR